MNQYHDLLRSILKHGTEHSDRTGVDQIARRINEIETNPNSRRLIVSGWDPRVCDDVDLPPCHTLFQFKVEEGKALPIDHPTRAARAGTPVGRANVPLLHCQLY